MKLKKVLKLFGYRISEGAKFEWNCFGPNAWIIDFISPDNDLNGVGVTYDTVTTKVYAMNFSCEDSGERVYTWVDPEYEVAYGKETKQRTGDYDKYQCFSKTSFLEMALDAYQGKVPDYAKQNDVEFYLEPDLEAKLHLMAHEKGITFDELVKLALERKISDLKSQKT